MISTKNIPGGNESSISKTLNPGNHEVTITSFKLEKVPYKEGGYNGILNVVGPDMGEDFEGFFIDKDRPTLGRYLGQIGRVRTSEFPYADGVTRSGISISRDNEILRFVRNVCMETGSMAWFEQQDEKHDTIESFVAQFNDDKPFEGKKIYVCLGAREYVNKAGYTAHDLFLPRAPKGKASFKALENSDKVMEFAEETHIKKPKSETVTDFAVQDGLSGDIPTTSNVSSDFSLG